MSFRWYKSSSLMSAFNVLILIHKFCNWICCSKVKPRIFWERVCKFTQRILLFIAAALAMLLVNKPFAAYRFDCVLRILVSVMTLDSSSSRFFSYFFFFLSKPKKLRNRLPIINVLRRRFFFRRRSRFLFKNLPIFSKGNDCSVLFFL